MTFKPLYNVVDYLYHGVMDHMPESFQERSIASAFFLGSVGSYAVTKISSALLNKAFPRIVLGKGLSYLIAGAPFLYAAFDPDGAREIMSQHPTYTSGMVGACLGVSGGLREKKLKCIIDDEQPGLLKNRSNNS